MTEFFIKSTTCMSVLLVMYYLFLEKERLHIFNRFYLLLSLVFSLAVPFISIPIYTDAVADVIVLPEPAEAINVTTAPIANQPNYLLYASLSLYSIVVILLAIRFISNIFKLYKKVSSGTLIQHHPATLVLLEEETPPHTFLSYIFLNKVAYKSSSIEEEIYTHELAHIKQKHTYDLLFVEVLRVIFWFNPLLYFYRRAIQLNHEFLADKAVTSSNKDVAEYQQLLLRKASPKANFQFASSINYSLTKKRLIMMTKRTSGTKGAILRTASITLLVCLTLLICTTTVAQETTPKIDFKKVRKIEVVTPSPKELDSLKKANPAKFKDEANTRIFRTNYTLDENGTEKIITSYEQEAKPEHKLSQHSLSGIADIDPIKITAIKVDNVTEIQIASLAAKDPEKYKNAKAEDYRSLTVTYRDQHDKEVEETYYERYRN